MPQTYAERKKKYIEKLKLQGTYDDFKKKKAAREKERRRSVKESLSQLTEAKRNQLIAENRFKCRKRVEKCRKLKRGELFQESRRECLGGSQNQSFITKAVNFPHSYKTKSALAKAVAKLKKSLPSSPSKRNAAVATLLHSFDEKDQQVIIRNDTSAKRKKRKGLSLAVVRAIQLFYERDDISRISPNVKDARYFVNPDTGEKELKQIRHLMFKLTEIYAKFVKEYRDDNCGESPPVKLSKFCALRQQYIKLVGSMPHNVCFCQYHANFIDCCSALNKYIPEFPKYDSEFTKFLVCEQATKNCFFKTCLECSATKIKPKLQALLPCSVIKKKKKEKTKSIKWMEWTKDVTSNRFQKHEKNGTIEHLMDYFIAIYPKFLRHFFNKREQADHFNTDRRSVNVEQNVEEALLQIDFAENFKCEAQDEIQQAHWNQQQISLFTSALHHAGNTYSEVVVSDNTKHCKETLVAYLFAVLLKAPSSIKYLKIWSDGPFSQFKNKYIAAIIPLFEKTFGIKIFWNYFASSHGKGCIDGIGAAVKKRLKTIVLKRKAIVNCTKDFVNAFETEKSKVGLTELSSEDIDKINFELGLLDLFKRAKFIKNISKFHQLQAINNHVSGFETSMDGYKHFTSSKKT